MVLVLYLFFVFCILILPRSTILFIILWLINSFSVWSKSSGIIWASDRNYSGTYIALCILSSNPAIVNFTFILSRSINKVIVYDKGFVESLEHLTKCLVTFVLALILLWFNWTGWCIPLTFLLMQTPGPLVVLMLLSWALSAESITARSLAWRYFLPSLLSLLK